MKHEVRKCEITLGGLREAAKAAGAIRTYKSVQYRAGQAKSNMKHEVRAENAGKGLNHANYNVEGQNT